MGQSKERQRPDVKRRLLLSLGLLACMGAGFFVLFMLTARQPAWETKIKKGMTFQEVEQVLSGTKKTIWFRPFPDGTYTGRSWDMGSCHVRVIFHDDVVL